jgi:hypothetical protein
MIFLDGFMSRRTNPPDCFSEIDGKQYELELGSVEYLLANEFREGNIILDLTIQQGKNCSGSVLQRLFGVEYLEKQPEFLGKLQKRIEDERLLLVSIDPSYGCSLIALCKTISWRTAK